MSPEKRTVALIELKCGSVACHKYTPRKENEYGQSGA